MRHGQFPRAEGLILQLQLAVSGVVAVLAVAEDGAADAGHVGADLVGAAGDEPHLQQGQTARDGDGLILGLHILRAGLLVLHDLDDAAVGVLEQIAAEGGVRGRRTAKGDAEVGLFHLAALDGGEEQLLGLGGLGDDDKAAGAGVETVAEGGGVDVVLLILALLAEVEQSAVEQGVVVRAVHSEAGGLVDDEDLGAVVDHLCRAAGVLPRWAFHPLVGVQHIVEDEQLDLIARHDTGGEGLLFAVELDLVFAQGLVQPTGVQRGELLHQIVVQPGGGETFYFQYFHGSFLSKVKNELRFAFIVANPTSCVKLGVYFFPKQVYTVPVQNKLGMKYLL